MTRNGSDGTRLVFVDLPGAPLPDDALFLDETYNRDDCLAPLRYLREALALVGCELHSAHVAADLLARGGGGEAKADYLSLGQPPRRTILALADGLRLRSFFMLEPPAVASPAYERLPELSHLFEGVYLHNVVGDGYSLSAVNRARLHEFRVPQAHNRVFAEAWGNPARRRAICMINANKGAARGHGELYSERIRALVGISPHLTADLFGPGWDCPPWDLRRSRHWSATYIRHRRALLGLYRGMVSSKYATLSQYDFSLCFENMQMAGYVTEKPIDCLLAGTVPVYLGAPNVTSLIPPECFIDARDFTTYRDLAAHLVALPSAEVARIREAGRQFIGSEAYLPFTKEAFARVVMESLGLTWPGTPRRGEFGAPGSEGV